MGEQEGTTRDLSPRREEMLNSSSSMDFVYTSEDSVSRASVLRPPEVQFFSEPASCGHDDSLADFLDASTATACSTPHERRGLDREGGGGPREGERSGNVGRQLRQPLVRCAPLLLHCHHSPVLFHRKFNYKRFLSLSRGKRHTTATPSEAVAPKRLKLFLKRSISAFDLSSTGGAVGSTEPLQETSTEVPGVSLTPQIKKCKVEYTEGHPPAPAVHESSNSTEKISHSSTNGLSDRGPLQEEASGSTLQKSFSDNPPNGEHNGAALRARILELEAEVRRLQELLDGRKKDESKDKGKGLHWKHMSEHVMTSVAYSIDESEGELTSISIKQMTNIEHKPHRLSSGYLADSSATSSGSSGTSMPATLPTSQAGGKDVSHKFLMPARPPELRKEQTPTLRHPPRSCVCHCFCSEFWEYLTAGPHHLRPNTPETTVSSHSSLSTSAEIQQKEAPTVAPAPPPPLADSERSPKHRSGGSPEVARGSGRQRFRTARARRPPPRQKARLFRPAVPKEGSLKEAPTVAPALPPPPAGSERSSERRSGGSPEVARGSGRQRVRARRPRPPPRQSSRLFRSAAFRKTTQEKPPSTLPETPGSSKSEPVQKPLGESSKADVGGPSLGPPSPPRPPLPRFLVSDSDSSDPGSREINFAEVSGPHLDPEKAAFTLRSVLKSSAKLQEAIELDEKLKGPIPDSPIFAGYNFVLTQSDPKQTPEVESEPPLMDSCSGEQTDPEEYFSQTSVPFDAVRLRDQIRAGGGQVYQSILQVPREEHPSTILITNGIVETPNYLLALSLSIRIHRHDLIYNACVLRKPVKKLLDDYVRMARGRSVELSGRLVEAAPSDAPFAGCTCLLYLSASVSTSSTSRFWWHLLTNAGAARVILNTNPTKVNFGSLLSFIVSDEGCEEEVLELAARKEIPVYSTLWVIQSLIHGKVRPFDSHPDYIIKYPLEH